MVDSSHNRIFLFHFAYTIYFVFFPFAFHLFLYQIFVLHICYLSLVIFNNSIKTEKWTKRQLPPYWLNRNREGKSMKAFAKWTNSHMGYRSFCGQCSAAPTKRLYAYKKTYIHKTHQHLLNSNTKQLEWVILQHKTVSFGSMMVWFFFSSSSSIPKFV